jgi:hypothetical protein
MSKSSATAGYILPAPEKPELVSSPPNLTLKQFMQTVLVGISGLSGTLVRPEWQQEQPKQPDINVDWVAFGIEQNIADNNAYIDTVAGEGETVITTVNRNETLQVNLQVYGPNCYEMASLIRDGFQLTQNLAALKKAKMGFGWDEPAQHAPDLVNGRWVDRYRMTIYLRRQVQRFYPVLSFTSASIQLNSVTSQGDYQKTIPVGDE